GCEGGAAVAADEDGDGDGVIWWRWCGDGSSGGRQRWRWWGCNGIGMAEDGRSGVGKLLRREEVKCVC
ncbi:hypothetical protein Tco_0577241, partial [Tanacetum coccineum]